MSRPSTPRISREKAVALSIEMIDQDGLEDFSLPRLAQRMNVRTPSLYHHFESRADLAEAISAAINSKTRIPAIPEDPARWQDWFVALAVNFRTVVFRHRNAAPLLLEYLPRRPFLTFYNVSVTLLENAGVPDTAHLQIVEGLETVVFGATLAEAVRPTTAGLSSLEVDAEKYPQLASAIRANTLSADELFEAKIRSFLIGALEHNASVMKRA